VTPFPSPGQDYRAGQKALGRAVLALVGIPLVLLGVLLAWWKPWRMVAEWSRTAALVTDAERGDLKVGSDSIRHASLGFSVPNPGPGFGPSPELQSRLDATLANRPEMVAWILRRADPPATVTIEVSKMARMREETFRGFARGVRGGTTRSGAAEILEDSVSWQGGTGEYRMTYRLGSSVFAKMRCRSRGSHRLTVVVCVQTASGEVDALDFVLAGLVTRP